MPTGTTTSPVKKLFRAAAASLTREALLTQQARRRGGRAFSKKRSRWPLLAKPLPPTTAAALCVMDCRTGKVLAARHAHSPRSVASLTKILAAKTVLRLLSTGALPSGFLDIVVKVSEDAAATGGTSAGLQPGDCVTVLDLLYGALLPSGNDAIASLAGAVGKERLRAGTAAAENSVISFSNGITFASAQARFVKDMNAESARLGNLASASTFLNPHGMDEGGKDDHEANLPHHLHQCSTAHDMAVIAAAAMREHPLFRNVVATKHYQCKILAGSRRVIEWQNTNKLLWRSKKVLGLKTGWTKNAGPCLCSAMRLPVSKASISSSAHLEDDENCGKNVNRGEKNEGGSGSGGVENGAGDDTTKPAQFRDVIVVTLQSESTAARWPEHNKLHRWAQRLILLSE
jgi:D-alanyl-D-alanine carboxypeptidase